MLELTNTKALVEFAHKAQHDAVYDLNTLVITPTQFQVTNGFICLVQDHYQEDEFRSVCGTDVETFSIPTTAMRQALKECKRNRQLFLGRRDNLWQLFVLDSSETILQVPLSSDCCGRAAPNVNRILGDVQVNIRQGDTVTVAFGAEALERLARVVKDAKGIGMKFEFTIKDGTATMDPVSIQVMSSPDNPVELMGGVMPIVIGRL